MLCQACEKFEEQVILKESPEYAKSEYKDYHLCQNCLIKLVLNCLSKTQYKNLIKNGHSPNEFMIHEDFYDKKGNALQPKASTKLFGS